METRGLLKRIAAVTMAALTVVTSSGVDVNLLTANANELTKQATENVVGGNTNKALQKKDANVGAQEKLSFSTNEALKKAVDDAGFNINVKTNKVTSAAIKYNQSLLTLGEDFTATAKRTDCKQNGSKYNYVYTVTVTGKGKYTGAAKKTGVTVVSTTKPKTTNKKVNKASGKSSSSSNSSKTSTNTTNKKPRKADTSEDTRPNIVAESDQKTKDLKTTYGWEVDFSDDPYAHSLQSTTQNGKYLITYYEGGTAVAPAVNIYYWYKDKEGKDQHTKALNSVNVKIKAGETGSTGQIEVRTTSDFIRTYKDYAQADGMTSALNGFNMTFQIKNSIATKGTGAVVLSLDKTANDQPADLNHPVTFEENNPRSGSASGTFEYTGTDVEPRIFIRNGTFDDGSVRYELVPYSNQIYHYSDNHDKVGEATITATIPHEISTYEDETLIITFTITPRSLDHHYTEDNTQTTGITVDDINEQEYTGKAIEPEVEVNDKGIKDKGGNLITKELVKDTDYTVTYKNNTNAGEASVIIKGMGNYSSDDSDSIEKKFTIVPKKAVKDDQTTLANDITIGSLDCKYTGSPVTPDPVITYAPTGINTTDSKGNSVPLVNTLVKGKDYDIEVDSTRGNNTSITQGTATEKEKPLVHIRFKGNYSGEYTSTFRVTADSISSNGTVVSLNGNKSYTVVKENQDANNSGSATITYKQAGFSTEFDPIEDEYPPFSIKVGNNTLQLNRDYQIKTNDGVKETNTTSSTTWPSVTGKDWKWSITYEGKGNYSGTLTVQFEVTPLDINKLEKGTAKISEDGKTITATLKYKSTQNPDHDPVEIYNGNKKTTNFTVTYTSASTTVGPNIPLTLEGTGNYTGKRTDITAGRGYSLTDDISRDETMDLKILYFDPFTGKELQQGDAMPYYGPNVVPKVIILKKDSSGSSYTQIKDSNFEVTANGKVEDNPDNPRKKQIRFTVKAASDSTELYGEIPANSSLSRIGIEPLDLGRAYTSKTASSASSGGTTDLEENGDIVVTVDNDSLTNYTDVSIIQSEITLRVKPRDVGKTMYAKAGGAQGSTTPPTGSSTGGSGTGGSGTSDENTTYSWPIPNYWSGVDKYGTLLTPGEDKDYTLDGDTLNSDKKTVDAVGRETLYKGVYHIDLNKVNIGTSKDYDVSPKPAETYDYTGKPLFPEVALHQISTDTPVPGAYYWIIYQKKGTGQRYVLTANDKGEIVDGDSSQKTTFEKASGIITVKDYDSLNLVTQEDPALDDEKKITNDAANFIEGDFTVTIKMKTDDYTKKSTKLYGTTATTSKVVSYSIKKKDASKQLEAKFNNTSIRYQGTDENAKLKTPGPNLLNDKSKDNKGPKLSITDTKNPKKELKQETDYRDYSLDRKGDEDYFKYPGVKTVTVTGEGTYEGSTTASYTVTGNLTNLYDDKYYTFKSGDITLTKDRLTIYTSGAGIYTTANNQEFSLDDITIGIPGVTDDDATLTEGTDYTMSPSAISQSATGNVDIIITGKGVYSGQQTLKLKIVETRSDLKWASTGTEDLELRYRPDGYKLGERELAILSGVSGKNVNLTQVSKDADGNTNADSGDTVTINPKDGAKDPRSDMTEVKPTLIEPGTYDITIKGPPASGQPGHLQLSIKYDLSTAKVDIGLSPNPTPYDGNDPYGGDDNFKKAVKVTVEDRTLKVDDDYSVSRDKVRDSYANAGEHKITIDPAGNRSKYFSNDQDSKGYSYTITPLSLDEKMHAADLTKDMTYTGSDQTIANSDYTGKVTYDGIDNPLTIGVDYTVSYPDGLKNVSRRKDLKLRYLVTGKGNYEGAATTGYFIIKPYNLQENSAKITIPDQYYQGVTVNALPAQINVSDMSDPLVKDTDYTVTSIKNTNVKSDDNTKAQVKITGKGNYTGELEKEYIIKLLEIENAEVRITEGLVYTGNSYKPSDYVTANIPLSGGISLRYGIDYTVEVTYAADGDGIPKNQTLLTDRVIHAGDYTIVLKAKAGSDLVAGDQTSGKNLHIEQQDISDKAYEYTVNPAEWTGNEVKPDVYRGGTKVDSSWLTYSGNIIKACGSLEDMRAIDPSFSEDELPTVTVKGHGDFKGEVPLHFTIGHKLSEASIDIKNRRITYDGAEHKLTKGDLTLSHPSKLIDISKVDFTITYPSDDYVNAGQKTVLLTATAGAFYGNATKTYTIYPIAGSVWDAEFTDLQMDSSGMYYVNFEGAPIVPEVRAYRLGAGGTKTTIPLGAADVTYANNTAAGTASVTIKPKNYEGTKVLYFKILGVDISQDNNVYIAFSDGISRRKYTGSAIQPKLTVTFAGSQGTVTLRQDKDYSITYENNTNAGAANVKVTGIGNYSGTRELPFSIWADLNDKTSTFTIPKQMYTGEPITELTGATIKAGGNDLRLGTDYTLAITSTDAYRTKGTAIFTAEGQYYEGTRTVQFDIGNDASMYNVLGVAATYVFDHQAHKPMPVVTDKQGTVYAVDSVSYASTSDGDSCINAGNVRMEIVITSHGQSVTIPYNYMIEPRDINTANFTPIGDVNYNGKAHTPNVRITDGTHLLTGSPTSSDQSADFTYSYLNNTMPGTAQVAISGINNYTGTANLYFSINVKTAPQMIITAMPSGRLKVTWNKVSGVSGYRIFYSPKNGSQKQVDISKSKKSTYLTGLSRGVTYTVGVQSYVTANGIRGYSSASVQSIATSTKKPTISSAKSTGKGKIKITWKKVTNATAYMVYRKSSGSKKWTRVKTTKSTSFTNTGLKSGRKYTYKVISYKQSGVKRSFSKYSKGKTVRAK